MIGRTNAMTEATGGGADKTYFGDGSDGKLTIASGETYTVQVVEDAESAILNLKSLTIDSGGILTTSGRCDGLFIKVKGDCTINGTVNMDKKAPLQNVNEDDLATNPCIVLCGSPVGGSAGKGGNLYESNSGKYTYYGGTGGAGHVFGGGYGGGGGGMSTGGSGDPRPPVGITWPYKVCSGNGAYGSGGSNGGAAPGGSGAANNKAGIDGDAYGGGVIYLYVAGKLVIGSTGLLTANGGNGAEYVKKSYSSSGYSNTYYSGSGGGGGGGVICVVYNGTIVNGGKLSVAGGTAGASTSNNLSKGTDGSVGFTKVVAFSTLQN